MLSYQHEFHAGNAADTFKHTALCLILQSLCAKDKPLTVIDTHAGSGVYSLDDERLVQTGEARGGIEALFALYSSDPASFPQGLKLYLEVQRSYVENRLYAGSPEIELAFWRRGDTLFFLEKHPKALSSLKETVGSRHAFIRASDSFGELASLVPPLVRRGLVFIDPSYEEADEWQKVAAAFEGVRRKWNTAVVAVWYPLLVRQEGKAACLVHSLESCCKTGRMPCEFLNSELVTQQARSLDGTSHLLGSGLFVANPPWHMEQRLEGSRTFLSSFYNGTRVDSR